MYSYIKQTRQGFTLIEMLIVILIIVILIAIAVPAIVGYRRNAEETADMAAVRTLQTALEAASITEHPSQLTGSTVNYTPGDFDTDNPPDDAFSTEVMELLGQDFEGNFRFGYHKDTGNMRWISWWDDDDPTETGVMLHDIERGNFGYLSDLVDEYDTTIHYMPLDRVL